MRIKYITEDGLNTIKGNIKTVYKGVIVEGNSLSVALKEEGIIKNTPFEIEDFKLDMSQPADSAPLTDIENVNVGDEVLLFGSAPLTTAEFAKLCSTINYEIVCLVGKRVPRVYYKNSKESQQQIQEKIRLSIVLLEGASNDAPFFLQ